MLPTSDFRHHCLTGPILTWITPDVADFRFPASLFDRPNLNVDHTGIRLLHRLRDIEA